MKKNIILLSFTCIILLFSSCDKWLDVEPKSQVKASELFSNEAGFKEALAGVYTLLTEQTVYGKELTYGMMGVLGHEWSNYPAAYQPDFEYDYTGSITQGRISAIWSKLYQAIANANYILENIDDQKNVFSGDNYAIIKGESLALRAFIHFELLKLFSPHYSQNPSSPAIPYVIAYSAKPTEQYTVHEITQKIITDFKLAKDLLRVDPIFTGKTITELNDNGYLMNRQLHLNYYAVEGLLARAYLYVGAYSEASTHANNVINSNKFRFITNDELSTNNYLIAAPEHLFALQVVNLSQYVTNYLSESGTGTFSMITSDLDYMKEDLENLDFRHKYLFESGTSTNNNTNSYTLKYSAQASADSYYKNKISMIKLSELYFILAECALKNNSDITPYINIVRKARNLKPITNTLIDARPIITQEFVKEFFAEGQLFNYYKSINLAYPPKATQNMVDIKGYTFPIPESELDAVTRNNNR